MKKSMILLIALGLTASLASTAKAEYAVSFTYTNGGMHYVNNYPNTLKRNSRYYPSKKRNSRYYPSNRGHYRHGYYIWPRPAVQYTKVVTVYPSRPKEIIVVSQERLGISDIIVLSKAGLSDATIIEKIIKTSSTFNLRVEEIEILRREGVSVNVINFMLKQKK